MEKKETMETMETLETLETIETIENDDEDLFLDAIEYEDSKFVKYLEEEKQKTIRMLKS